MIFQIGMVIVLSVGIAALYWVMVKNASAKIEAQYRKLATRFDLEFTAPEPQLKGFIRPEPFVYGTYRGREISISVPGKGLQNTRQTETVVKIKVADRGLVLQMTPTGFLTNYKQRDSGIKTRSNVGDGVFDSAIDLRTNDIERIVRILNQDRRGDLLKILRGSKATVSLHKGVLSFAQIGLITSDAKRESYEFIVETFCSLVEVIDGR